MSGARWPEERDEGGDSTLLSKLVRIWGYRERGGRDINNFHCQAVWMSTTILFDELRSGIVEFFLGFLFVFKTDDLRQIFRKFLKQSVVIVS